ncbi:MAG: L-glutamate gamma-semialdehyde dehydrogenase [Acidimicrobiia bacterium]|nr:L-glutamate gamma-semialdehyde dehydrogenase [Acidimicrobiia bacterium]
MTNDYSPTLYSDFTDPASRAAYELALNGVASQLGAHAPLVIGGEEIDTDDVITSVNPSKPDEVVGTASKASPDQAEQGLAAAWKAYPGWSETPAAERAEAVARVAAIMAERKFELAAWQTYEASKNWGEAEGDVAEAIDFADYYAVQARRLAEPVPTYQMEGEVNESRLQAMGAGVAIPPWNFPLAIPAGMALGPVAAGNTVVLKPASATPMVSYKFMEIVAEAGIPAGVINFLPGAGGEVGDTLIDHPTTRFINFTGSKEVGLRIAQRSAVVHPGQSWLKRSYMEMGGKDAIIVDETADLDAAAEGIVRSAFGFQGQKCSACSRAIAVGDVYDEIVDRVVALTGELEVGPATENFPVTAVISAGQHKMILDEIDQGKTQAKLVQGGSAIDLDGGWFIQPTVFADVPPDARLAQHEIFGPVLSMIRANDYDHAVDIFNGTEFGLTGGLFSGDRSRLDEAKRRLHVGNLYLNRKITGAFVGVQPFGGFKMSGSNSKAGGPDYLRLFMEMKTVAEKL